MLNGAVYVRVSTEDQTEYSPDAQLKAIKDYALRNDILISDEHIYMDEGISGRKAEKRPAFMRMVAAAKIKPKPFDIIMVHKFDRFARSREDSVVYKSLLMKEAGIKVVSITEHVEDDKFSVILEAMLEAMAEYYSLNLSDEVKKGMTEKARRGGFQTKPPYGYRVKNGGLVIDEDEAELVRFIFSKHIQNDMNTRGIAVYLNGIGARTREGGLFESRYINYILNNPIYIGKVRWTPTGKAKRNFTHPDTIVAKGIHRPIIDDATWDMAQEKMRTLREIQPKHNKPEAKTVTWLKGLVRCGTCGSTLSRSAEKYLQCSAYSRGQCKISCCISYKRMEALVLDELKKTYTEPFDIHVKCFNSAFDSDGEINLLLDNLEKTRAKLNRIRAAFESGVDSLQEYKKSKERIEAERRITEERLSKLRKEISAEDNREEDSLHFKNLYSLLTDERVDTDIKCVAAHFLINRITYRKQEGLLVIEYKQL